MRIRYYDWLEALAAFLVCSVHAVWLKGTFPASIAMSITPMAVPLFFMVHGALVLTKPAKPQKHIRRFLKVLFQVYTWNTIYLLLSLLTGLVKPESVTLGFLYDYYIVFLNSDGINSGHLWFIYALLAVYVFLPFMEAIKSHNEKLLKYLWIVCFISSFLRYETLVYGTYFSRMLFGEGRVFDIEEFMRNLSPLGEYANCILYFLTGYFISQWVQKHPLPAKQKSLYMVLAVCVFLASIALLMLERYIQFGKWSYNWKPLPHQYERIGSLTMAISVFFLFSQISFREGKLYSIIRAISQQTLDIFYIHIIYARYFLLYLYDSKLSGVWQNYLRAAAILLLSVLTGKLLRKIPIVKKLLE